MGDKEQKIVRKVLPVLRCCLSALASIGNCLEEAKSGFAVVGVLFCPFLSAFV